MRQLLLKIAGFTVLIALSYILCLYVILFHTVYEDSNDFMASIIDKVDTLKNTPSPKIVLIGGSNIALGLNSEKIQETLRLPVVNMGLHAAIGLKYLTDIVRPYIGAGDIIVVIPEYSQFYQNYYYGREQLLNVYQLYHKEALSPEQWLVILKYGGMALRKKMYSLLSTDSVADKIYNRQAFNKWGDVVSHLAAIDQVDHSQDTLETVNKTVNFRYEKEFNDRALVDLGDFFQYVIAQKAKPAFIFPCFKETLYEQRYPTSLTVYDKLKKSGIHTYSSPEDYIFPDSYFFDTEYHLNAYGTRVRTDKVIAELQEIQQTILASSYNRKVSSNHFFNLDFLRKRSDNDEIRQIHLRGQRYRQKVRSVIWEGRWADAWISNRAKCSLRLSRKRAAFSVTGNIMAYTVPATLLIKQDGKTIKEVRFDREGRFSFTIELAQSNEDNKATIEFFVNKTFNPKTVGLNGDDRNLGIQLDIR
jgi:hypothetical protein